MKSLTLIVLLASTICNAKVPDTSNLPINGKIEVATLRGHCESNNPSLDKNFYLATKVDEYGDFPDLEITCVHVPEIGGSDLTLIALVGNLDLTSIDFYNSTTPIWRKGQSYTYRRSVEIKEGMTYSVVLNTPKYRGLMVFKVISYKNDVLTIEYATREYELFELTTEKHEAKFIQHEQKNSY